MVFAMKTIIICIVFFQQSCLSQHHPQPLRMELNISVLAITMMMMMMMMTDVTLPLKEQPDHEHAESQRTRQIQILRLRKARLVCVFQVSPGDVVRKPEPLVPEPSQNPRHVQRIRCLHVFAEAGDGADRWPLQFLAGPVKVMMGIKSPVSAAFSCVGKWSERIQAPHLPDADWFTRVSIKTLAKTV